MRCRKLLVGAMLALAMSFTITTAAGADDCGDPRDCEETGGFIGITSLVGGLTAVAAAAAAAGIGSTSTDAGPESEADHTQESEMAAVTVDKDRVEIAPGDSMSLLVTGWLTTASGGTNEEASMPLKIDVPPVEHLSVSPTSGFGRLNASVSAGSEIEPGDYDLQVSGSWKGRTTKQAVTVVIGGYIVEVEIIYD